VIPTVSVVCVLKRKYLLLILLILSVFSWAVLCLRPQILPVAGGYTRHKEFPPLVYLPEYEQGPKVLADAAILVEATSGKVLYAKNEHKRRAPASTTKIMTALVVLERAKLNEIVRVSRRAASVGGSSLHLRAGDRLRLSELLQGVLLCSGNDGSTALAEHVAGSEQKFAELMNLKAKELGALHTRFQNAHGLRAPSHYTTAFDLALMARYALMNPVFFRIVATKEELMEYEEATRAQKIRNTNRLLWSFAGADGVKTGTTNEAGYCLVASATRDGRRYVAVALASPDRWGDCARMLEYAFSHFALVRLARADRPVGTINVLGGCPAKVRVYPRRDLTVVLKKGEEGKYRRFVVLQEQPLRPPLKRGSIVGRIGYSYEGSEVEGVDLIVREPVRRRHFWGCREKRR